MRKERTCEDIKIQPASSGIGYCSRIAQTVTGIDTGCENYLIRPRTADLTPESLRTCLTGLPESVPAQMPFRRFRRSRRSRRADRRYG